MESLNFIADQLHKPVIIVDRTLHVVCYNHASEICFQYNAEEVIGRSINILIPIEYHHSHNQLAKHFIDSNDPRAIAYKFTPNKLASLNIHDPNQQRVSYFLFQFYKYYLA
ncbi:PAS domain-containing protein [Zooshikella ganghwensis]|uniref:PAS domain-containing protein n=1 Tax=Zooshikella ganghwensis TaxID=202772 RepID=UPI00146F9DFD